MSEFPISRITLDQWRSLVAVVDAGTYAKAAAALHKSQSSVTYAVQKMQELLGVKAFEIRGRKAMLTPTGELLYRRARLLLDEAAALEHAARKASAGWESEITLAAEVVFPTWLVLECLHAFGEDSPQTHIELLETVTASGPGSLLNALVENRIDLALSPHIPSGFNGEPVMQVRAIPVAHPDHPLHQLDREIAPGDLRKHRQLVVRDTLSRRDKASPMLDAEQRWTVSNMPTSIGAVCRGYGFAWLPAEKIRDELAAGALKPLPLRGGAERMIQMYLMFRDRDAAGPGVLRLAEIIRRRAAKTCNRHLARK